MASPTRPVKRPVKVEDLPRRVFCQFLLVIFYACAHGIAFVLQFSQSPLDGRLSLLTAVDALDLALESASGTRYWTYRNMAREVVRSLMRPAV